MSSYIALEQPVSRGGIRSVNYFNGRLLTATDLTRGQQASREALARLGMAVGDGVAFGLEVEKSLFSTNAAPVVKVKQGLAINPLGQALRLDADIDLALTRQFKVETQTDNKDFRECRPLQTGSYIVSAGVYLLTIAPSIEKVGRAKTSSLEPGFVKCNTDEAIEGVQFRLVQMPLTLGEDDLAQMDKLRNTVAYQCFSSVNVQSFASNPFGTGPSNDGLIDKMRGKEISDCEVPLAVICWTLDDGITFIDLWSVRRRITRPSADNRWPLLTSDRRASEAEAMFLQFQEQIKDMIDSGVTLSQVKAKDRFDYLPPVGLLPISTGGLSKGFDYGAFFNGMTYRKPIFIEGAQIRSLSKEAFDYPPIDTDSDVVVWLYIIRENAQATLSSANPPQTYLIFASGHTQYRGEAHYDVHHWNFGNFS